MNIFHPLLLVLFEICKTLVVGRITIVKPWTYKHIESDDAAIEWSDDFGHSSRVVLNYTGKLKKLTIYCNGKIHDTNLKAERIYICARGRRNSAADEFCDYVSPLRTTNFYYARLIIPLHMSYDSDNHRGIGTIADVPVTTRLSISIFYCKATPGAKDSGLVWRETNALYLFDMRDIQSHGKLSLPKHRVKVKYNVLSGWIPSIDSSADEVSQIIKEIDISGNQRNKWLPQLDWGIEWFLCPDLNFEKCYKNKSNSVYDVAYNHFRGAWAPSYSNYRSNLYMGGIKQKIYDYISDKYFMVYIRGKLFRIYDKIVNNNDLSFKDLSETDRKYTVTCLSRFLFNDSEVSYSADRPQFPATEIIDPSFSYSGLHGEIKLKEGENHPLIKGVSVTKHQGKGITVFRFQGPYGAGAGGSYTIHYKSPTNPLNSALNVNGKMAVRIVPYLQTTKELYRVYQIDKDTIEFTCPTFFENTAPTTYYAIEVELFGIHSLRESDPDASDEHIYVKERMTKAAEYLSRRLKRPIEIEYKQLSGTPDFYPRKKLTFKNFYYVPSLSNRFTMACVAFPWRRDDDVGEIMDLYSMNLPWIRTNILFQVFPTPRLQIKLLTNPCIEICTLVCYFEERKQFEEDGLIIGIRWEINGKPLDVFSEEYSFFPVTPLPKPKCSVTFTNPDNPKTPFKVLSTSLDFGNITLRLLQATNLAKKQNSISVFAIYFYGFIFCIAGYLH